MADLLTIDVVARTGPVVVAGQNSLSRTAEWVEATEITETGQIPTPHRVILTCGVTLPDDSVGLRRLVKKLREVDVSAVFVLLGPRYVSALPPPLAQAADHYQLPLVALGQAAQLSTLAQHINSVLLNRRVTALAAADTIHRTFNELTVEGAGHWAVVHHAAELSQRPVVLENLGHQVLSYASADQSPSDLLADWEERSRRVRPSSPTGHDEHSSWLIEDVGARGQTWGRLLMLPATPHAHRRQTWEGGAGPELTRLVMQRAADALALNQLVGGNEERAERQAHADLLRSVLTHSLTGQELALRAHAAGVPMQRRRLVGAVVQHPSTSKPVPVQEDRHLEHLAVTAIRRTGTPALVAAVHTGTIALLLSLDPHDNEDKVLKSFSLILRQQARLILPQSKRDGDRDALEAQLVIGAGPAVESAQQARDSLSAALETAGVFLHIRPHTGPQTEGTPYATAQDLHLPGLLHSLRDDSRVHRYIENELGPLLDHDARHSTHLTVALAYYLDQGRNKTAAAEAAHMSRPSMYDKLERVQRILAVDLNEPRTCLSLQVAIHALNAVRAGSDG
ncbi:PucR family transcriptional regulator [Streptomyces formicae]|uniref:PucR family transcriptional regulator ligand-binding domain-containing protein n=1 Tax=Streptomyces formicae TaxID=1616117 RepID=A0ABY3WI32_9ACTN|nr:PucR family transcriptional regulator [Streptomyces formicae]UNM12254.1 PucR family transcriptional regulator ligand-binding domain-containing protein [Streptomyces formicae]